MVHCIAALTKEYRQRMYHLLALYLRPLRSNEPVVCIDEKSLQLLAHSRRRRFRVVTGSRGGEAVREGVRSRTG